MADIRYNIITDTKGTEKKLDRVAGSFEKLDKKSQSALGRLRSTEIGFKSVAAGAAALIAIGVKSVQAFDTQVGAINALNQALGNQGNLLPGTSQRLQEYASSLQQATIFGDEAILKNQAFLASMGANEEQIKALSGVTLDYATATGKDLKVAFEDVGKAFAGQSSQLSRLGIDYKDAGSEAERLDAIVAGLSERFGGQAAIQTETISGKMTQLKNAAGDVLEQIGKFVTFLGTEFLGGIDFANTALSGLGTFFGEILPIAISEFRALIYEAVAGIFDFGGAVSEFLGKIPGVSKILPDPEILRAVAKGQRELATEVRDAADAFVLTSGAVETYSRQASVASSSTEELARDVDEATTSLISMTHRFTELKAIKPELAIPNQAAEKYAGLLAVVPGMQQTVTDSVGETVKETTSWRDVLGKTQGAFSALGIDADSVLGKIFGKVQQVVSVFDSLLGLIGSIAGGFGGLGSVFGGGAGAAGSAAGGLFGLGSLAGPIGIGIAAVGSIIPLLGNLFGGRDAQTVMEEAGRDLGTTLSESLAQRIHESGRNIQLFLPEIFAEGNLAIDRFALETGDVLAGLEQGLFSAQDASAALGNSVPIITANIDQMGVEGVLQLERILSAADRLGVSFQGMGDLAVAYVRRAEELGVSVNNVTLEALGLDDALALLGHTGDSAIGQTATGASTATTEMQNLWQWTQQTTEAMRQLAAQAGAVSVPDAGGVPRYNVPGFADGGYIPETYPAGRIVRVAEPGTGGEFLQPRRKVGRGSGATTIVNHVSVDLRGALGVSEDRIADAIGRSLAERIHTNPGGIRTAIKDVSAGAR